MVRLALVAADEQVQPIARRRASLGIIRHGSTSDLVEFGGEHEVRFGQPIDLVRPDGQGHFPDQPVMPGVIIVEAFGQAAAALTAYSLKPNEVEDKLVYLMSVDKARFRNPIIPDCKLFLEIKAIRSRGRVWRYQGIAKVNEIKMADAKWAATIMDRSK